MKIMKNMDIKIILINKGNLLNTCDLFEVCVLNIKDKKYYNDDEIEYISQQIKEKMIIELSKSQDNI